MTPGRTSSDRGVRATRVAGTPSSFERGTLAALEFEAALADVADRAVSPFGAARIQSRRPRADIDWIAAELTSVAELAELLVGGDAFRPDPVPDLGDIPKLLGMDGATLTGPQLVAVRVALDAMTRVRHELERVGHAAPGVAALAVDVPRPALARALERALDPDGTVRDGAAPEVDRARRRVRETRHALVDGLERMLRGLPAHEAPPDAAVTLRDGRYVIPIAREARARVPGIVHGESASGATLFVEPVRLVDDGNALAAAEAAEHRAVRMLLRKLTEEVRTQADALLAGWEMCVQVDEAYARARYAADYQAARPTMVPAPGQHRLRGVRHPLLLAEGVTAVPFDLDLDPDETAVIVSGPNTGGKTVLLKALGLSSALAQSGVLPPVGEGTVLPVFDDIIADIGDRQSIAASLSTFSAHVQVLREALERAERGTLVLLDEIGSGTDPVEGAALAGATISALIEAGARLVATTHLGALKELAVADPRVVNASLQFDAETLAPTYRLLKGVPGRSYGIVIARRLGLPSAVVEAAEGRVPEGERTLDKLLAEVEARLQAVSERETDAEMRSARLERDARAMAAERDAVARDRADVEERAAAVEREGREQARRFLLEARKRVEEALGVARAAVSEATAREARKLVEEGIRDEAKELERLEAALEHKGWTVKRGGRREQRKPPQEDAPPGGGGASWEHVDVAAASELDLRGMTADEARDAVLHAVDAAVLADLPVLRIIHGKGTGVLRATVTQLLTADRRVADHRLAPPREGGSGVTIAELVS